jgi:hypothetical protein
MGGVDRITTKDTIIKKINNMRSSLQERVEESGTV